MKILITDTETGGLNPKKHSVFSVGAVVGDLNTGKILETFEAFHKMPSVDDYVFDPEAIQVHGILPQEAFEKGLSTSVIADKLVDMWLSHGAQLTGGHNHIFDKLMLAHQIFKVELNELDAIFSYRSLDTLPIMRIFSGNDDVPSGASMKQGIKVFNIDMSEFGKNKFHTALFDSICCFKILCKFRQVLSSEDVIRRLTQ